MASLFKWTQSFSQKKKKEKEKAMGFFDFGHGLIYAIVLRNLADLSFDFIGCRVRLVDRSLRRMNLDY